MKFSFQLAAGTALIACVCIAHAQGNTPEKFYGGLEVGRATVSNQTGDVTSDLVSQLGGTATATQSSSVNDYRFFGGYKLNENVDLELGYLQTSRVGVNFSGRSSGSVSYTGTAGIKYSGFDYSVLLRPAVSSGMNNLFFRLGGHSLKSTVDSSFTVSGTSYSTKTKESGAGTLFGIGYDLNVAKNADLRVSVNRLNSLAGQSDANVTVYSVGVLARF
jgi:hypothetical protein